MENSQGLKSQMQPIFVLWKSVNDFSRYSGLHYDLGRGGGGHINAAQVRPAPPSATPSEDLADNMNSNTLDLDLL